MASAVGTTGRVGTARAETLSTAARRLTQASAVLSAVLGLVLFVAPGWSAERFAWAVTPLMTMTIGAWCLGNAVVAWEAARLWRWGDVFPLFVYLWVFALGELAVLVGFNDLIPFDAALTWPYLAMVVVFVAAAVVGIVDVLRLRPSVDGDGTRSSKLMRAGWAAFGVALVLLASAVLLKSGPARGGVFPEFMTPFTLKAFGVFYLALGVGAISVARSRRLRPSTVYASRATSLTLLITIASLVHLDRFELGERPGQWFYLGAYLIALAGGSLVAWRGMVLERRAGRSAGG